MHVRVVFFFFHFLSLRERHLQVQPGAGRCVAAHQRLGAAARGVNPASQPIGVPCHATAAAPPTVCPGCFRPGTPRRPRPPQRSAPPAPHEGDEWAVPRRGGGCGDAASRVARGAVPRAACDGDGPQRAFFGGAEVRATCGGCGLLSLPATAARKGRTAQSMRGFGYCLGAERRIQRRVLDSKQMEKKNYRLFRCLTVACAVCFTGGKVQYHSNTMHADEENGCKRMLP